MFKVDITQLLNNLSNSETKSQVAIKMFAQEGSKKFENYAKKNRRWTDRTGHARQRLVGYVEVLKDVVRINIAHGVDYGIYLEMAHERRYAILKETVDKNSEELLKGYEELERYMKP